LQLFKELQRRNVFRVAIGYIVSSWLLAQVADLVLENIGAPNWVMQTILLVLALGFPVVLFFSWAYEVTPEGIKRESEVDRTQSTTQLTGRKLDRAITGVLVIALAYFAYDKFVLSGDREAALIEAATHTMTEQTATEDVSTQVDKSIAVLPFVNMSSDPEQEYFSDGLSEEILNLLAKIDGLKVIGRTSSFAFKGKNEDLRSIGKALGVTTILEGSVRKSGDRVRVTAQLIKVSDGSHLWSDTYDRTLIDIFAVQDDVAASIIDALQIHVSTAPTRGRPTENPEAYALFLKARAATNESLASHAAEALALEAIELDPTFAEAYELLAVNYWNQMGGTLDQAESVKRMRGAATKALAIDPSLALARAYVEATESEGYSLLKEIEGMEQVLRAEPNNSAALTVLVWGLQQAGYFQEAMPIAAHLVDLDPLSALAQLSHGLAHVAAGDRSEAVAVLGIMNRLNAGSLGGYLGLLNLSEKRDEIAISVYENDFQKLGVPTNWARKLVAGGRDPETGQAFLDHHIPQLVDSLPKETSFLVGQQLKFLYLGFGFLDRYFELIDADWFIHTGTVFRESGFTAHPSYLKLAKEWDIIDIWEKRGPPDMCEKLNGQWVCE
jgi:TolB-like protein